MLFSILIGLLCFVAIVLILMGIIAISAVIMGHKVDSAPENVFAGALIIIAFGCVVGGFAALLDWIVQ